MPGRLRLAKRRADRHEPRHRDHGDCADCARRGCYWHCGCLFLIGFSIIPATGRTAPQFKASVATRAFVPAEPYEWSGEHALLWSPADRNAQEKPQLLGPPDKPLFDGGRAATDAPLAPALPGFPLIVLSYGTGGDRRRPRLVGAALARAAADYRVCGLWVLPTSGRRCRDYTGRMAPLSPSDQRFQVRERALVRRS